LGDNIDSSVQKEIYTQKITYGVSSTFVAFGGVTARAIQNDCQGNMTIEQETRIILDSLRDLLFERNLDFNDVVTMCVYIQDMSEFSRINNVYSSYFDVNPPSR